MIDLHAHLLPGIDDGPGSQTEAVALGRAASAAGIRTAAATPHIDYLYDVVPAQLAGRLSALRIALREAGVPLEVVGGGELAAERVAELSGEDLAAIGLGGGPWILLECPLAPRAGPLAPAVEHLQGLGYRVLLAHPERSPAVQRDQRELRQLIESGARCALTASAFVGRFGRQAQQLAERLLREGSVHVLTSDAHDHHARPPDLRAGLAAATRGLDHGDRLARWLTEDAPAAILAGEAVPAAPPPGRRGAVRARATGTAPGPAQEEPTRPSDPLTSTSGWTVLSGSTWVAASALLPQLFTIAGSIAAARFLGPHGLGRQSYIAFVSLSVTWLLTGGLVVAVSRSVAESVGRGEPAVARGIGAWMWRILALAAAVGGGGVAIVGLAGVDPPAAWVLAGVVTSLSVLQAGAAAQLTGMQRWRELAVTGMATGALAVVATIAVLAAGGGIVGMFAVEAVVVALNLACAVFLANRAFALLAARRVRVRALERSIARYALITTATIGLTFVVQRRSEFFFLQYYSSDAEIGFYSIAFAATAALTIVPERLGSVMMSAFATVFGAGDPRRLRVAYGRALRLMMLSALPLTALAIVLGPAAVRLVYGSEFARVGVVLVIMLAAVPLAPFWNVSGSALTSVEHAQGQFVASLAGAVTNIALAFAFIPANGAVGAAMANVGSQGMAGAVMYGYARTRFGAARWEPRALLRTALASAGAALVSLACLRGLGGWPGVVAGLAGGAVAFPLLSVALRILPGDDARWLDNAIGQRLGGRPGMLLRAMAAPERP